MFFKSSMPVTDPAIPKVAAPIRCLLWCAVSSEAQSSEDKESLPEQREAGELFIADFGRHYPGREAVLAATLEVAGSRSIRSLSEARLVYPQYAELERLLEQRKVEAVIVRETSRLGRNRALVTDIEELAREAGCVIIPRHGARPTLDDNDDGHALVSAIQSTLAQQEVAQLMRRKEMGMKGRIKNKRLFASQAPYGYRNVRDSRGRVAGIEVVPEQMAVVRLIFLDLFLERGMGEPAIAAELNRLGISTPSYHKAQEGDAHEPNEQWTFSSVHQVLNRVEAYAGYVYWNRTSGNPYIADGGHRKTPKRKPVVYEKGTHDPILSEEEVERVMAEKADRTYSRRLRLWSGSAVCARCDVLMIGTTIQSGRGISAHRVDAMLCPQCEQTIADASLMEATLAAVERLENNVEDDELAGVVTPEPSTARTEANALVDRIADLDTQRSRLLDGWQKGRMTDDEYDERAAVVAKERAQAVTALERARRTAAEEVDASRRGERVAEVRTAARELLALANEHPSEVRPWLRRHVRAFVVPRSAGAGRGARRVRVEFI